MFAVILATGFGFWTYLIVRNGFVWYSVFPATVSGLMVISVVGMITSRDLPPESDLPPGATPIQSSTAEEEVATAIQLHASGAEPEMFADDGQVGVALRFIQLMRAGQYEAALELADATWNLCRIQSWLWSRHLAGALLQEDLEELAESLSQTRKPPEFWNGYVLAEAEQFVEAWATLDPASLGAASRRRRMAPDYDLVILAPLGTSGGYFVTSATMVPNALTFLMHRVDGRWLVANNLGSAPPTPGLPPVWWVTNDPTMDALPDT